MFKEGGLTGSLVGTLHIKPDSALAREDSRYPITRTGIGDLIQRIVAEANDPQTIVNFLGEETTADGRAVYKIQMTNPPGGVGLSGAAEERSSLVFIDKELFLPVKAEIYDADGVLYERHYYRDLKLNVDLPDKTFEL